jgi:signal transduction histidine kinase
MAQPLEKNSESDLDKVYDMFMKVMIMEVDLDLLNDLVIPDITGFGTTIDERIHGIAACRKLVENQIRESENANFHFDRQHLRKRVLSSGLAALIVEEGNIKLELPDGTVEFPFRISTTLDKIDGHWKVVHWHGSTPVMSEDDTWHINDWKTKNQQLEEKVNQKTAELAASLEELRATQTQLVVQEKLAALGQLAAGIAHEIKNPMNFVNNFSELSLEYVDEIKDVLAKLPESDAVVEINDLLGDVADNLKKIHQHGTRADSIVKSMLMHSRGGSGILEPTDLNELLREYVNLAFHGMRAGKNPINVKINYELDENIGTVPVFPEDFSRVVLNLCKNAFDAMRDKTLHVQNGAYLPSLTIRSAVQGEQVTVSFEDNGPGITEEIRKKLFEPFFTTKKGTEGTGLGLSITHDIVKNHNGVITLESEPDAYARFVISIPKTNQTKKT